MRFSAGGGDRPKDGGGGKLPRRPGHGRMDEGARRRISLGAILPAMKPASALRQLHWAILGAVLGAVFALVLLGPGRAWAQDAHPLDLDQTRAALTATEAALRDKNLTDADLQTPQGPERRARRRPSGGDRGAHAAARRLGQAARGADAQIGRDRAHHRRRGQGAREREEEARHARRQPARRPRHAAAIRRPLDPHQHDAAPAVRTPDIRPVVERPRSAALGRGLAGGSRSPPQ